jgi:hypothetical protein
VPKLMDDRIQLFAKSEIENERRLLHDSYPLTPVWVIERITSR